MLVGDFLEAMQGYYEGEFDRLKSTAELIRRATTYFVNTQPIEGGARTPQQLWPFPWDKEIEAHVEIISDEELQRRQNAQDEYLMKNF